MSGVEETLGVSPLPSRVEGVSLFQEMTEVGKKKTIHQQL